MNKSKPSVVVTNPEKIIEIEGGSFAELILHQAMHAENLRRAVRAMAIINGNDQDERLSELQLILQAMLNSTAGVLVEQVRVATTQGLVFELCGERPSVSH